MKAKTTNEERRTTDRRRHNWLVRFIINMHSSESQTSWMRWAGTIILTNIMLIWTLSCVFDAGWKINFTLEDMPTGLVYVITVVLGGKVLQSVAERAGIKAPQ